MESSAGCSARWRSGLAFGAAEAREPEEGARHWTRLERAASRATDAVSAWRGRALAAEAEVSRLRHALEQLSAEAALRPGEPGEVRQLRAENAALQSRMSEARKRVEGLLQRLAVLEARR